MEFRRFFNTLIDAAVDRAYNAAKARAKTDFVEPTEASETLS